MMETPELLAAFIIAALGLGTLAGMVAARIAAWHFFGADRAQIARDQQAIARQNELLDERRAIQLNIDNELRVREEAVVELERGLRRRAKATAATIHNEEEHFDTLISVLDVDDIPHPSDLEDTAVMEAVTDD